MAPQRENQQNPIADVVEHDARRFNFLGAPKMKLASWHADTLANSYPSTSMAVIGG
jgi:hypothetical protein